jgi:hypothetical protein
MRYGTTDAELDAEQEAIAREHADLNGEHARLQRDGGDVAAHLEHARKLHQHINRQRALIAGWQARRRDPSGPDVEGQPKAPEHPRG